MSAVAAGLEAAFAGPPEEGVAETYLRERGKPMPGAEHAICQMRLGFQFMKFSDFLVFSELGLELNGRRIVPDLCVYRRERESQVRHRIWVTEPPQLAVEIMSPSQTLEDMSNKINLLLESGVASVWLLIPLSRVISIYQPNTPLLSATSGVLTDPVSGISVNVDEIFA